MRQQGVHEHSEVNTNFNPLVLRGRRAREQAERDQEILAWVARFRFVDASVLAERFEVSRQQINARLRRFEQAGLVARHSDAMGHGGTVTATHAGMTALGLPLRRPPRTDTQVRHELALTRLVARLERNQDATTTILTERQMRTAQAAGAMRFSVEVPGARGGTAQRWPDVVVVAEKRRLALELELTGKGTTRLRDIIAAYAAAPWFTEVRFLAGTVPVARRLHRLMKAYPAPIELLDGRRGARLTVEPWRELAAPDRQAITDLTTPAA